MSQRRQKLHIEERGREAFGATWERQLALHRARVDGAAPDTLILVEHEPVITLGRQGEIAHLLTPEAELRAAGFDLFHIERGGDITYHGPGQLVGYPVLSLRERGLSVRAFVSGIEAALIATAARFGIEAGRSPGFPGVWVGRPLDPDDQRPAPEIPASERHSPDSEQADKLAAIGVAIRGGVSYHGFALNVHTNLAHFEHIVPCGITGRGVTSLAVLLGRHVTLEEVAKVVEECFGDAFP